MTRNTDSAPESEGSVDLTGWEPGDVIKRWEDAICWANGSQPTATIAYQHGWFCLWHDGEEDRQPWRYRRKQIAEMIWRLENNTPSQSIKPIGDR